LEVQVSTPLENTLQPDEMLLWEGQPNKQRFLLRGWWAIPFSILWCGFAFFWEGSVLSTNAPTFFRLWGIPFVLAGLYFVFGRFFVAAREAANTWYVVTDRRILIQSGTFQQNFTELNLLTLPYVELSGLQGGVGTITFGAQNSSGNFAIPGWPMGRAQVVPAFQSIPNARDVYEIIKRAQGAR
jgi:PH (Pleckstrin Homology) domain-containing protein